MPEIESALGSPKALRSYTINSRIALRIMQQPDTQIAKMHDALGPDDFIGLLDRLSDEAKRLSATARLLDDAQARLLVVNARALGIDVASVMARR